jgi:hypothetical protein
MRGPWWDAEVYREPVPGRWQSIARAQAVVGVPGRDRLAWIVAAYIGAVVASFGLLIWAMRQGW